MDSDEWEALREIGVDPDDPEVQAGQQWVADILKCWGLWLRNWT
ncbi:hypothetical protein NONI108955_01025 [Nocardia ninae]|uniref:Uncharacterized protein n=1 Tax=Nocardia ninae NBRC 108245 TaxID=1210091 RepID=A0A511MC06_9NOCA|nr:hypothetical protein [Nocardia ninae]GEM38160.1 hypothetical protein NN4_26790 [Nocardia ninae NBRC 108245]